jgi:hypothetical protein
MVGRQKYMSIWSNSILCTFCVPKNLHTIQEESIIFYDESTEKNSDLVMPSQNGSRFSNFSKVQFWVHNISVSILDSFSTSKLKLKLIKYYFVKLIILKIDVQPL